MTLTLTPEPSSSPTDAPRVKAEAVAPDGGTFTQLTLRRDGVETRRAPFVGATESEVYDYEAQFGQSLSYQLTGFYLPVTAPDWSESWASVAAWTGSGFSASGGKAVSTTNGAQIVRSASGTIQRVSVSLPDYVRVELLTAVDVVVCSVQVTSNVTLAGTSSVSASGGGSFELTLSDGIATASAVDSSWSVDRPYTGVPTKVRVVSLYPTVVPGITWSTTGQPSSLAVDSSNNIYVADMPNRLIRKYTSAGVTGISFATTGDPYGVAVDSSGNIYVADISSNLVRKFNSAGVAGITFSTTGLPTGIGVDSSGNIYVADYTNKLIRKYNSAGTAGITWSTTGDPYGVAVDSSNNIYVADYTNHMVRKFSALGVASTTFTGAGGAQNVGLDSSGNVYIGDYTNKLIRKYNSAGTAGITWSTTGTPTGVGVDSSGNVYVADYTSKLVRKYVSKTNASVDDIVTTLVTTEISYSESATTQLDETRAWLVHPSQPSLSVAIDENQWSDTGSNVSLESAQSTTHELPTSVFSPPGRDRSVSYPLGPRRAGLWTLVLQMANLATRDNLLSLLADGAPLLLRSPEVYDWDLPDGWYAVGDVTQGRIVRPLQQKYRTLTLPLTPSESPPVALVPEFTYGDLLLVAPTYQDVLEDYATYLDVLTGNAS